jgi:simple sugar transport system ATP-binding protein
VAEVMPMPENAPTVSTSTLSLRGIRKTFGGVVALEHVDLDVNAGEIVALVGDNGAGKSTLVKIIAGVYQPTEGEVELDGDPVSFANPSESRDHGIEVVYQDLALADQQPVYRNLFLGRELVKGPLRRLDANRMQAETSSILADLDVRIPSTKATIRDLSGGQRQGVAIGRATHWATRLVLMDEPTAALGVAETARVEQTVGKLRERGLAVLLVSHNLEQVFRLTDRICVLRRGHQVGVVEAAAVTGDHVVSMITGLS